MKDERTETWNPYTLPTQPTPQAPDWRRDNSEPVRFEPKANWIDPVAGVVRPR